MKKKCPVDFDVIIVGSGPAGVSAAFPLIKAGLRVLMVDGGQRSNVSLPKGDYLDLRRHDSDQWKWMIGEDFYSLGQINVASPKLRVPTHSAVFQGFAEANKIDANEFIAVGSLAAGGLSNSWGCGVAAFTNHDLATFPVSLSEMSISYSDIASRIGISGGCNDDLSAYFGLDEWSQAPIQIDEMQKGLLSRYQSYRKSLNQKGFRLGRSRLAVLTAPKDDRRECDLLGNCLWGCQRGALYSAANDLRVLCRHNQFNYKPGFVVKEVLDQADHVLIKGKSLDGAEIISANRVLLAAGTLASTRLALNAINHRVPIAMQSCPTAAFMLWLPRHLGRDHGASFGLGQLSFVLDLASGTQAFGSLFSTAGIPVAEFVRHIPFGRRYGLDLLRRLLSSCIVGNIFLPGAMTDVQLQLNAGDRLVIQGGYSQNVASFMRQSHYILRNSFLKMGGVLIPKSFKIGNPGSDIHYAASLPMSANPIIGQTNKFGELVGANRIYVVDGACLSSLPAKSHTLTIMANADRIAKHIARISSSTSF